MISFALLLFGNMMNSLLLFLSLSLFVTIVDAIAFTFVFDWAESNSYSSTCGGFVILSKFVLFNDLEIGSMLTQQLPHPFLHFISLCQIN